MRRSIRMVHGLALPAVLALLTGCASLPDMAPYRDATLELRSAVVAGGNAVQSGLESAAASYEAGDPAAKQLALQTLAAGTALRTDLFALLLDPATASPFLPTTASPVVGDRASGRARRSQKGSSWCG